MNAQRIAEASRDAMWANDRAAKALGIVVEAVGPGTAALSMTVREDMVNGHDLCHGGLVATLADTAFAYACNAYNEVTVASGFDINLIAAGRLGDSLTARASEVARNGRTGVYDVTVSNQRGEALAALPGRPYTMKGQSLLPGLAMGKTRCRDIPNPPNSTRAS